MNASAALRAALLVAAFGAGSARAADGPATATPSETAAPGVAGAAGASPDAATPSDAPAPGSAASAPATTPAPAARAEPLRLDPPRTSLLPLAQPLWSDLTTSQQQVLAPFASQWNALPLTEKRAWADLARRFPKMKPDEQKRVEKRIEDWAELTPDQRRIARANYLLAQKLARENLLAEWENYQSMTPEQRSVLNNVGTSNTAARHLAAPTGLAKEAAQPLPRRVPKAIATGSDGNGVKAGGVTPTVGPAGSTR